MALNGNVTISSPYGKGVIGAYTAPATGNSGTAGGLDGEASRGGRSIVCLLTNCTNLTRRIEDVEQELHDAVAIAGSVLSSSTDVSQARALMDAAVKELVRLRARKLQCCS